MDMKLFTKHIKAYGESLQDRLDPGNDIHQKLVQKGLLLFRQKLVYHMSLSEDRAEAKVQDVTPVEVILPFHEVDAESCTCPEPGICRHKLAVFFAAHSRIASTFSWTEEWKRKNNTPSILETLKRGSDLLKEQTPELPEHEKWLQRIREAYRPITVHNPYLLDEACRVAYKRLFNHQPFEREWKPLYQLFAAYESFKMTEELWKSKFADDSRSAEPVSSFFQYMYEEADEAIYKLSVSVAPFAFDAFIAYLRKDSRFLLTMDTSFPAEAVNLYRKLWSGLFKQKQLRKAEMGWLREQCAGGGSERLRIAYIHLAILQEDDDAALSALQEFRSFPAPYAFMWISHLQQGKNNKRLLMYLPVFLEKTEKYLNTLHNDMDRSSFCRLFFQKVDEDLIYQANPNLLEKIYMKLLPHSRFQYSDYLLTRSEYRKWTELQSYLGNSAEWMDRSIISLVSKEEPSALLPLYHYAVDDLIKNRNRESYKKAVRLLKKLRTIYKKEKKTEAWDRYFERLLQETKRLRAFHEECMKGKLIHNEEP